MKKLPLLLLGFLFCISRTGQTAVVAHPLNLSFSASTDKDLSKKLNQVHQTLLAELDRMAGYYQMRKELVTGLAWRRNVQSQEGSGSHAMADALPSSKSGAITLTSLKYSADDQVVNEQNGPAALLAKRHSETIRKT